MKAFYIIDIPINIFSTNIIDKGLTLTKLKEEAIRHAIKSTNGNVVEAARKLKIGRATLYRLADRYKIEMDRN